MCPFPIKHPGDAVAHQNVVALKIAVHESGGESAIDGVTVLLSDRYDEAGDSGGTPARAVPGEQEIVDLRDEGWHGIEREHLTRDRMQRARDGGSDAVGGGGIAIERGRQRNTVDPFEHGMGISG